MEMKSTLSRFVFAVVVLVASILVSSEPSKAVTYSYSNELTNVSVACSPQPCSGGGSTLTIQIIDELPLGASGTFNNVVALIDFGAYLDTIDGLLISGESDFTYGTVTLSSGSIVDWNFFLIHSYRSGYSYSVSSTSSGDVATASASLDDPSCCIVGGSVTASGGPGRWTPSITPIPAALPLFATGLGALGLLGWRRKRKATASADTVPPWPIKEAV
jgi:hypothetical protein